MFGQYNIMKLTEAIKELKSVTVEDDLGYFLACALKDRLGRELTGEERALARFMAEHLENQYKRTLSGLPIVTPSAVAP